MPWPLGRRPGRHYHSDELLLLLQVAMAMSLRNFKPRHSAARGSNRTPTWSALTLHPSDADHVLPEDWLASGGAWRGVERRRWVPLRDKTTVVPWWYSGYSLSAPARPANRWIDVSMTGGQRDMSQPQQSGPGLRRSSLAHSRRAPPRSPRHSPPRRATPNHSLVTPVSCVWAGRRG